MAPIQLASSSCDTPESSWQRWCRLCAFDDPMGNINVFCKGENEVADTSLATAIGKYFWVNIKATDKVPKYLCGECHSLVTALMNFTDRVNKVQSMFCTIQATNLLDPNELRIQYGIFDEDRQHIIKRPKCRSVEQDFERETTIVDDAVEEILEEMEDSPFVAVDDNGSNGDHEKSVRHNQNEEDDDYEFTFEFADEEATQLKRCPNGNIGIKGNEYDVDDPHDADENDNDNYKEVEGCNYYKEFKYKLLETGNDERENVKIDAIMETINDTFDEDEQMRLEVEEEAVIIRSKVSENPKRPRRAENELLQKFKGQSITTLPSNNGEPLLKRRRGRPSKYSDLYPNCSTQGPETEAIPIYECSMCSKKYKNLTSYRKHMIECHNTEPDIPEFMCSKCEKTFPSERQLSVHSQNHLPLEDKLNVPCPYCEKKFTKIAVMRQHISGTHFQEKPFVCDECGRPLKTLAALHEHKLVHTNECPFECDVCGKRFKNKPRLKVHYETHTETTYACSECGMQLNTRRTLKMHMLVHSDNRRYKCDFCGTEFKRSKALKNHLILHTGMRPYKCNFCGKAFSNGSNCRSHKKKAHSKELAEEEAKGVKIEPTIVPKLAELRSGQNLLNGPGPRQIKRPGGGLNARTRAMLISAEERKLDADSELVGESTNDSQYSEMNKETAVGSETMQKYSPGSPVNEEEDEGETVIYEIIDEI